MFRLCKWYKNALLILILFTTCSFASFYNDLNKYSNIESVTNILNYEKLIYNLKKMLSDQYPEFIINFAGFGEPENLADGALFIEGWPRGLRLEYASSLVIKPDGKIYAAWVNPNNTYIKYVTNDTEMVGIQPNIKKWAERFDDLTFAPKGK